MNRTLGIVTLLAVSSCLYDAHDRCGDDQVLTEDELCRCAEGMIPVDGRCAPCAEHEVAAGDHCTCAEGYARDGQGVCAEATEEIVGTWPTGQGEACASQLDCEGMQAAYCESFFLHQCLVEGCVAEGAPPCSEGWLCCDFTDVAGISVCVDSSLLEGGTCPAL